MKKITTLLLLAFIAVNAALAQSPNLFKYQAVLRDASGNIMANSPQTIVVNILQGSSTGISVYQETHNVTSTAQGILNLNIGGGTVNSGVFANINWSAASYWVKLSIGSVVISNGQLLSVPYTLYSQTAGSALSSQWLNGAGGIISYSGGNVGIGTTTPTYKLDVNGVIHSGIDNGECFRIGNDMTLQDINISNHVGLYGAQDPTVGSIKLGSNGGIISGKNGNIGIGTTTPAAKLDVAGTVRIADGTQGANKVLTSDASGNATWVTNTGTMSAVVASLSGASWTWTTALPVYTGSTITLPAGKWSVQISILIPKVSGLECWVRSTLTDGSGNSSPSSDIIGANLASGYKSANSWGMVIGTIIINNTHGANRTYYYWGQNCEVYAGSFSLANYGGSGALEDQIIAYPMN